jgi:SnoaL-like protein
MPNLNDVRVGNQREGTVMIDVAAAREVDDRLALLELEGDYARRFDNRDGSGWANLFTEDGVYQGAPIPGMPDPTPPIVGRANLAEACNNMPGSSIHMLNAPQISIEGDRATGRVHFVFENIRVDEHENSHQMRIVAYYHIEYVRTAEGWRIRNRVTVPFSVENSSRCGYNAEITLPGPPAER